MDPALSVPPVSKASLTPLADLAARLQPLIGRRFRLSGKTRTDGSNLRKLVAERLQAFSLPPAAGPGTYRIVPPKRKGVPRILREFIDTYIVTTGRTYNLQVWNRNPSAASVQVEYDAGPPLLAHDIRFVLVRVEPGGQRIRTIVVLSPDYIVDHFGGFGRPTVKQQLIITERARSKITATRPPILFYPDEVTVQPMLAREAIDLSRYRIRDEPQAGQLVRLERVRDLARESVIGARIPAAPTKSRGQVFEGMIASLLGYPLSEEELLAGGYPDIRHQALEVKIQDSPTVDLGRYSPEFDEPVPLCPGFSTRAVRYLIALTDPDTALVEGAVVVPGSKLGEHFTFVADSSFKAQRSIPMEFFERLDGMAVANP